MQKDYLNYYELLEVRTNATNEEIIKAYKKKAVEFHPDKNDGHKTANVLFQYINQAKEVLTDPKQRLDYDYISGVKKKPEPKLRVEKVYVKDSKKSTNWEAIIGVGLVGILVGVALGNSD